MMNKKNILVVSNPALKNSLDEWTTTADLFEVALADTHEKAIEMSHHRAFDLVLVDGTDHEIDAVKLGAILPLLIDDVQLLHYEGESVDTLQQKIKTAFDRRKAERMKRFLVLDAGQTSHWSGLPGFSEN